MSIDAVFPVSRSLSLAELHQAVSTAAQAVTQPFDPALSRFFETFSRSLFRDKDAAQFPALQTLAFWLRKTELARLEQDFAALRTPETVRVPRGLLFHVPPGNVDTMFVYSWALSALLGNANVVRLSSRPSAQVDILLRLLTHALSSVDAPVIRNGALFVRYGHDAEANALLSAVCDGRILWGGDQTIQTMRGFPLSPGATELTFPDRFSLTALSADAVAALEETNLTGLAEQFFNDAYWFDQMGCSSPRLVAWCGDAETTQIARERFWPKVADVVERKRYLVAPHTNMEKLLASCRAVLDRDASGCERYGAAVTVVTLAQWADVREEHTGGGFFYEVTLPVLADLAPFIRRRDQTLAHFGFDRAELVSLAGLLNGRGIDRIVPVGRALAFHRFWDGHCLLSALSRVVHIVS